MERSRSTTILSVRRDGTVVVGGDGQVTMGDTVAKHNAVKIRRVGDTVLCGFAGSAADAFALLERFEAALKASAGNVRRAAVDLAKQWRTDRILRRLESLLAVVDKDASLVVSGAGDIIEPEDGVIGIGSGGPYAVAAARALLRHTDLGAREIVEHALGITAEICIYTNDRLTVEEL